jgi:hypothetical protein
MLAGSFGMFLLALDRGQTMAEARTMNVFARSNVFRRCTFRSINAFSNPWVWAGAGLQLAMAHLQLPLAAYSKDEAKWKGRR